jgi:prevent-host-death family protein
MAVARGRGKDKPDAISVSDAADKLGELVNRVAFGGETVIITLYDKPVARLVPMDSAA